MSANLSKYELLQHRHLGLLRALDDAGIKVTNVQGKPWQVEMPVAYRTRMAVGACLVNNECAMNFNGGRPFLDSPPFYPNVPNQYATEDWQMRLHLARDTFFGSIDGYPFKVEYEPISFHLLCALRAAIVAAPAKA